MIDVVFTKAASNIIEFFRKGFYGLVELPVLFLGGGFSSNKQYSGLLLVIDVLNYFMSMMARSQFWLLFKSEKVLDFGIICEVLSTHKLDSINISDKFLGSYNS
jgi:hypothetical protein